MTEGVGVGCWVDGVGGGVGGCGGRGGCGVGYCFCPRGNGFVDDRCQYVHLYLKQIIKIGWANIHEISRLLLQNNYRTYMYGVMMDPPSTFLFESYTKCSSSISYLLYDRLYYEIVYIMQWKWYLNIIIIASTWHGEISKVYRGLMQWSCEYEGNVATIVGYGWPRL